MTMTPDRLQQIIDAYGADWRRWPEAERDAARACLDADPDGERRMFEARQLEAALDLAPRPRPSESLRARVLLSAPRPRSAAGALAARLFAPPALGRPIWLSGAGVAAAICVGVLVGHAGMARVTADVRADDVLYQATLEGLDDVEILG